MIPLVSNFKAGKRLIVRNIIFVKYFVSIEEVKFYWQKKSVFAMRCTEIKGVGETPTPCISMYIICINYPSIYFAESIAII